MVSVPDTPDVFVVALDMEGEMWACRKCAILHFPTNLLTAQLYAGRMDVDTQQLDIAPQPFPCALDLATARFASQDFDSFPNEELNLDVKLPNIHIVHVSCVT